MTENLAYAAIWFALGLYAVLGGADFGAGIWDLITRRRLPANERRLLYEAIGPVWEANHVWLVFALVLTMTAFPTAFAELSRLLAVPFLVALAGIVFRGSAYIFRVYGDPESHADSRRAATFGFASALAPLCFGASAGAVAAGDLETRGVAAFVRPLPVVTALLAVSVCTYLAAAYLTRDGAASKTPELAEPWRRRALGAGIVSGVFAGAGLVVVSMTAPELRDGFEERAWPLVIASALAAGVSFFALWSRRFTLATAAAATAVATVLAGAAVAQFPFIVPPSISVADHAPQSVMTAMLWTSVAGALLVAPSLLFLLRLFKSMPEAHSSAE